MNYGDEYIDVTDSEQFLRSLENFNYEKFLETVSPCEEFYTEFKGVENEQ